VPNYLDSCPNRPADTATGCPPPDRDGDGVPNAADQCPLKPAATADGCPEIATVDPVVTEPPLAIVDPAPTDPPAAPAP
jgi:hypothetical protein